MDDRTKANTLQDKIDDDYKAAFKAKKIEIYMPLRPVLSILKQTAIDNRKELNNEEIMAILRSEVKKRKDAREQFVAGNRQDLVDQTDNEIKVIGAYLPAQMEDSKLEAIVKETITSMNATVKDTGKVMGAVMAKVKGQADGTKVKEMVGKWLK